MTPLKYLNGVLTVIACCLLLITLAVTGLIPTASAKTQSPAYATVPLNKDGSINVKLVNGTVDVNIESVGGVSTGGTIDVKGTMDVNMTEVNRHPIRGTKVPVEIEKE